MSFILEALKKSEEQRKQQATTMPAGKRTLVLRTGGVARRRGWLLFSGALLVSLLCGWAIYSASRDFEADTPPRDDRAALTMQATEERPAPALSPPLPGAAQPVVPVAQDVGIEPAPVPRPLGQGDTVGASREDFSAAPRPTPDDGLQAAARSPSHPEKNAAETYPHYRDLSRNLHGQIPDITVSLHFYAPEPPRRLVRINGRLLREGDLVDQSLRLVEIFSSGILLEYQGQRFHYN